MSKLWEFVDSAYIGLAGVRTHSAAIGLVLDGLVQALSASAILVHEGELTLRGGHGDIGRVLESSEIPAYLAGIRQVSINISATGLGLDGVVGCVIPISMGKSFGTLAIFRDEEFLPEELYIGEAAAAVIAPNLFAQQNERLSAIEKDVAAVKSAIGSLSFTELEAALEVFRSLGGLEGNVVAANIAKREGVTRSAIVNALRKLESAGLLDSHSMGVKGTYIRVNTPLLLEEFRKF